MTKDEGRRASHKRYATRTPCRLGFHKLTQKHRCGVSDMVLRALTKTFWCECCYVSKFRKLLQCLGRICPGNQWVLGKPIRDFVSPIAVEVAGVREVVVLVEPELPQVFEDESGLGHGHF